MTADRKRYEYTWRIGVESNPSAMLATDKPLSEDVILVDLFNGNKYWVQTISEPKEAEPGSRRKPVAHTWSVGSVFEDELRALRQKARYTLDEYSVPLADIVLLPRPDICAVGA
jgi:hypothetical protein